MAERERTKISASATAAIESTADGLASIVGSMEIPDASSGLAGLQVVLPFEHWLMWRILLLHQKPEPHQPLRLKGKRKPRPKPR